MLISKNCFGGLFSTIFLNLKSFRLIGKLQRYYTVSHSVSPSAHSSFVTLIKTYSLLLSTLCIAFRFPWLGAVSLFSLPGSCISFTHHDSASSGLGSFSESPCFCDADHFEDDCGDILQNVPQFGFIWCFSAYTRVMDMKRGPQREVPFPLHPIRGTCYQLAWWLSVLTLVTWLTRCLPCDSTVKRLSPFPCCTFWKQIIKCSPWSLFSIFLLPF